MNSDKYFRNAGLSLPEEINGKFIIKNYFSLLIWLFKAPQRFVNIFMRLPVRDVILFIIVGSLIEYLLCSLSLNWFGDDSEAKGIFVFNVYQKLGEVYKNLSFFKVFEMVFQRVVGTFLFALSLFLVFFLQKVKTIEFINCLRIAVVPFILIIFSLFNSFFLCAYFVGGVGYYSYVIMMYYGFGVSHCRGILNIFLSMTISIISFFCGVMLLGKYVDTLGYKMLYYQLYSNLF